MYMQTKSDGTKGTHCCVAVIGVRAFSFIEAVACLLSYTVYNVLCTTDLGLHAYVE